ncbi:MAG: hypothetical protein H0X70_03870 [Segetibacter sp.]|jgi:hypothetical protein|nr:hypothetical protein [Segetibacter sp.]
MNKQIIIEEVNQELQNFGLPIKENVHSYTDLLQDLSYYINHLITNDFNKLIVILYRMDVSEEQLHKLLKQQPNKLSSDTIAKLIIERQQKKMQMKASYKKDETIPEDEKW